MCVLLFRLTLFQDHLDELVADFLAGPRVLHQFMQQHLEVFWRQLVETAAQFLFDLFVTGALMVDDPLVALFGQFLLQLVNRLAVDVGIGGDVGLVVLLPPEVGRFFAFVEFVLGNGDVLHEAVQDGLEAGAFAVQMHVGDDLLNDLRSDFYRLRGLFFYLDFDRFIIQADDVELLFLLHGFLLLRNYFGG